MGYYELFADWMFGRYKITISDFGKLHPQTQDIIERKFAQQILKASVDEEPPRQDSAGPSY